MRVSVLTRVTFFQIQTLSDASAADVIWKHCGKGEFAHDEQFLLLPQCFQYLHIIVHNFVKIFF